MLVNNVFGIDLGTNNIKIYNKSDDSIMVEKNMIAIENKSTLFAYGNSAFDMYEKAPSNIHISYPLCNGVIADIKNMYLRAYITSAQLKNVKIGQSVKVFADYGNSEKKEYPGKVTWISAKSEFTPKTILTDDERADLVYAIKIAVKNDGYVKIGMYGEVKL